MKKYFSLLFTMLFAFAVVIVLETFSMAKNKIAYAEKYSITFYSETFEENSVIDTDDDGNIVTLANPGELEGYYFFGWKNKYNSSIFYEVGDTISSNISVEAYFVEKQNNFKIKKNGDVYEFYAVDNNNREILLSSNIESLNETINLIAEEAVEDKDISIDFDNIEIASKIIFPNNNFILTGTIIDSAPTMIEINADSCKKLTLHNLIVYTSNSNYLIEIKDFDETINLTIFDCAFYNDSSLKQVILNYNEKLILTTTNQVYISNSTYINYVSGSNLIFINSASTYKQKIIIPFEIDSNEIVGTISDSSNLPIFVGKNESYSVISNIASENIIQVTSKMALDFDANGGTYKQGYEIATNYFYKSITPFPNANVLTKTGLNFVGWFGKITYNETDYYFDNKAMMEFFEENFDLEKIPELFATDFATLSLNHTFSSYAFDPNLSNEESFLFYKVFVATGQSASFVAGYGRNITLNICDDISKSYFVHHGETLQSMTPPQREGYSFVNWLDEFNEIYDVSSPIVEDFELTADWHINSYQVTFDYSFTDNEVESTTKTFEFDEQIDFVTPTVVGYFIDGWFDEDENIITFDKMPARNLTLKANWQKKIYTFFIDDKTSVTYVRTARFGEYLSISTPERAGYTFYGWVDENRNAFNTMLPIGEGNLYRTLTASWIINQYKITYYFDSEVQEDPVENYLDFNTNINLLTPEHWAGHKFLGWYDGNDEPFTLTNMPNYDIEISAKWKTLEKINLPELNKQTYYYGSSDCYYSLDTAIPGFVISYKVNNSWNTSVPNTSGTYDVKIERSEDDNYAYFSKIVESGLTILQEETDLSIYIAAFLFIFILEIVAFIILKQLKKFKISQVEKSFSVILPFGVFADGQFAFLIISMVLAIFGFACIIYELVQVSKITNRAVVEEEENRDSHNAKLIKKLDDKSNDISIEEKVESILKKEGFDNQNRAKTITSNDDFDNTDYIDYFTKNKK